MPDVPSTSDRSWFIAQRWQQFEGEARANLLRITAIGTFYLIHLWSYFSSQGKLPDWGVLQLAGEGEVGKKFHVMVTLLAIAWSMLAVGVHLSLRARIFPTWISLVSTLGDVVFLTSMLLISNGPKSPLLVGYFLIIALASLRFDLWLVRVTTVATTVGYLCLLGYAKWPATFGRDATVDLTVPRYHQMIFLVGLALTGIIMGQVVRRVRLLTQQSFSRSESEGKHV